MLLRLPRRTFLPGIGSGATLSSFSTPGLHCICGIGPLESVGSPVTLAWSRLFRRVQRPPPLASPRPAGLEDRWRWQRPAARPTWLE
jgi:hypothetical protein